MNSAMSPSGNKIQVRNEITTELVDLILKCLRKAGEDESYLPLFKGVFTALGDVDENRLTLKLDGRGRDILFTGLIVRMIRYITEYVSIMIVCDDVQCKLLLVPNLSATNILLTVLGFLNRG